MAKSQISNYFSLQPLLRNDRQLLIISHKAVGAAGKCKAFKVKLIALLHLSKLCQVEKTLTGSLLLAKAVR